VLFTLITILVFELQTQGLCPRTPGLHAADSAAIPGGLSPPEDTGP